jgi:AcrR family transcriptional regulator
MARAKAGRRPARKAALRGAPEDRLIDAALALAERQGWRQTALAQIASEAGLPLHEAYTLHRSKAAILGAFTRRVDRAVLAETTASDEGARERLFDVLMRRFEALRPHREALRSIVRGGIGHPGGLVGLCRLRRSMRWMLEGAGLPATGCAGTLRLNAVVLIYLSVLRVFLADDSEDLGRTMAALDRALRRAEQLAQRLPHPRRRPAAKAA